MSASDNLYPSNGEGNRIKQVPDRNLSPKMGKKKRKKNKKEIIWDFLGDPGIKALHFHCRRRRFHPWSGS